MIGMAIMPRLGSKETTLSKGYLVTYRGEPTQVCLVGKAQAVWRIYTSRYFAEDYIKDCVSPTDYEIVEFDLQDVIAGQSAA